MFCTNCGKELKPGAKFCTSCGAAAEPVEETSEAVVTNDLPADETTVVSPDATSVSDPADATTVVSDAAETTVMVEPDATTVVGAPETSVMPSPAPEHDREADTAAAVASFDDVEPAPAAPTYVPPMASEPLSPAPEPPKKKGYGALIIGIVALIAVLAVGAALYVRVNGLPGSATAAYAADAPAQLSAKTNVRPKDANGKEMSAYVAYLISTKGSGDASSIATTPYRYEATDDSGFTLADFGDVEDGDYTLVIVDTSSDSSSTRYDVPVHYGHDNPKAPENIDPEPPAPTTDGSQDSQVVDTRTDEQKAADLYLAKCREYIDKYGEPDTHEYQNGTLATGLAVARLIDFNGDGMDELLVVCDTVPAPTDQSDAFSDTQVDAYKVEVWAYKDGRISKVYDEPNTVLYTNGASQFVMLPKLDGKPCLETWAISISDGSQVDENEVYTFDGDSFSCELSMTSMYSSNRSGDSSSYEVDGAQVSEDEFAVARNRVSENENVWLLSFSSQLGTDSSVQTISDTNATLDELKSRSAGNAAATTAATTSQVAYTSESVDKNYTIVNPYSPSSTQGVMWSYPQFSKVDGSTDSALDALNAQLAKDCEDDANLGKAWGPASDAMMVDVHDDLCASINGSIASVFSVRDETGGGAHGTDTSFGTFYDLSTGQAIDATTALNMSASDLQAAGVAGINAFLADHPSDLGVSADDISQMASEQDRYVRDDKGTFIITRSYELGSYAFGSHHIYVMANDPANSSIVGTEVADNY